MKKMNWLVWLLVVLPSLAVAASALAKLTQAAPVVAGMTRYGIGDKIVLLGALELLIVLLFVYPVTRNIGFFLLCSYLGGAIATHATHGELPVGPTVILTLCWVAMVYQKPYLFWHERTPVVPGQ